MPFTINEIKGFSRTYKEYTKKDEDNNNEEVKVVQIDTATRVWLVVFVGDTASERAHLAENPPAPCDIAALPAIGSSFPGEKELILRSYSVRDNADGSATYTASYIREANDDEAEKTSWKVRRSRQKWLHRNRQTPRTNPLSANSANDAEKNGEKEDDHGWEVFAPVIVWGKGSILRPVGMEGNDWYPLDKTLSGTLYAVIELRGEKQAQSVKWVPKEVTLRDHVDDLVDVDPPSGTGGGTAGSDAAGKRWLAIPIGEFPPQDTSISADEDTRPFTQLHVGAVLVTPPPETLPETDIVTGFGTEEDGTVLFRTVHWTGTRATTRGEQALLTPTTVSIPVSTLTWEGDVLQKQTTTHQLRLFGAHTAEQGEAQGLFAVAEHPANEAAPYEEDAEGSVADSRRV